MTNKDRVFAALKNAELCVDCLSISSGVVPRQTVYTICRSLSEDSLINSHNGVCDHCHKTKTTNRLTEWSAEKADKVTEMPSTEPLETMPFNIYWVNENGVVRVE